MQLTLSWGAFQKPPSWGGGVNLPHPHISGRKNAILTIFGKVVHVDGFSHKMKKKNKKVMKAAEMKPKSVKVGEF